MMRTGSVTRPAGGRPPRRASARDGAERRRSRHGRSGAAPASRAPRGSRDPADALDGGRRVDRSHPARIHDRFEVWLRARRRRICFVGLRASLPAAYQGVRLSRSPSSASHLHPRRSRQSTARMGGAGRVKRGGSAGPTARPSSIDARATGAWPDGAEKPALPDSTGKPAGLPPLNDTSP